MEITKIIEWDMGHRIPNHKSQCRNLHGHRYRAEVTITGPLVEEDGSSDEGMVLDFGDIKNILVEEIHDPLDHGFMWYEKDKYRRSVTSVTKELKNIVVDFIPTAENISKWIYEIVNEKLQQKYGSELRVSKVRLFETPNSWADYS